MTKNISNNFIYSIRKCNITQTHQYKKYCIQYFFIKKTEYILIRNFRHFSTKKKYKLYFETFIFYVSLLRKLFFICEFSNTTLLIENNLSIFSRIILKNYFFKYSQTRFNSFVFYFFLFLLLMQNQ